MDTPEDDLQAIRQILAELTTRVYRIERRLQMDVQAAPQPQAPSVASASPLAVPPPSNAANSAPAPQIPPRSSIAVPPPPEKSSLHCWEVEQPAARRRQPREPAAG